MHLCPIELLKASLHTLSSEACLWVRIPALLNGADNSVELLQGGDSADGERDK